MALEVKKHVRYFEMCLASFPLQVESEDANKLALVYFCLQGLQILRHLDFSESDRAGYSQYIYSFLITMGSLQGFRPSRTFNIDGNEREPGEKSYDMPSISATFFALVSLLALELDYTKRIDRQKILKFVNSCQIRDGPDKGAFRPTLDVNGTAYGDADMRTTYMAVGIGRLCNLIDNLDVPSITRYVTSRVSFNGGLSSSAYCEPHAGFTFCGLATLKLLNYDFGSANWTANTLHWLVDRQVNYLNEIYSNLPPYPSWNQEDDGGFNGRDNKFADTCYSWWCTGSMHVMNPHYLGLANIPEATKYLLGRTQNRLLGGFGKSHELRPDPLHTFLALASLALWSSVGSTDYDLDMVDDALVISGKLLAFLRNLWLP